jgi:hypothetical protein
MAFRTTHTQILKWTVRNIYLSTGNMGLGTGSNRAVSSQGSKILTPGPSKCFVLCVPIAKPYSEAVAVRGPSILPSGLPRSRDRAGIQSQIQRSVVILLPLRIQVRPGKRRLRQGRCSPQNLFPGHHPKSLFSARFTIVYDTQHASALVFGYHIQIANQ